MSAADTHTESELQRRWIVSQFFLSALLRDCSDTVHSSAAFVASICSLFHNFQAVGDGKMQEIVQQLLRCYMTEVCMSGLRFTAQHAEPLLGTV